MSSETPLALTAADTIAQYGMLTAGDTVAVGFSGGADSSALLHYLFTHREQYGISVLAVHVNHGIRGAQADRDEQFCRSFCAERGIPFLCVRRDVPAMAEEQGIGIEECARAARYEVFDTLLADAHATRCATAHHAADHLETALFHIARGTGTRGLIGIPAVRGRVVRPLLYCTRAQIAAYIEQNGLSFVTDSTNFDLTYARNRIRAQALPALEAVNGRVYEHFVSLSDRLREDEEFLNICAQKSKTDAISDLRALHPSILSRVLLLLWSDYSDVSLEKKHIDALSSLVRMGGQGARVSLPSASAYIDRGRLMFGGQSEGTEFCRPLALGENVFDDLGCTVLLTMEPLTEKQTEDLRIIYKKLIYTSVKSDKINSVYFRSRRPGDRYRFFGMTHSVKKLLQADKLTLHERERMPIFCDGEGILWLPGHGVRDGAWDPTGLHIYYCLGE